MTVHQPWTGDSSLRVRKQAFDERVQSSCGHDGIAVEQQDQLAASRSNSCIVTGGEATILIERDHADRRPA